MRNEATYFAVEISVKSSWWLTIKLTTDGMYQPYALFELQVCFRLQIHITANKYNWKKQAFYHIKFLYWTNSSSQTDFVGHVLGLTTNVKMLWEIFNIFEPPAIKSPLSCHSGHISRCPIIFFYKNFFSTNKHLKCWVNVRHLTSLLQY